MRIFIILVLVSMTSCVSKAQSFYYLPDVKDYVKPLHGDKYFFALDEWHAALKRQPVKQGRGEITLAAVKKIQAECNKYAKYEFMKQFPTEREFEVAGKGDCKGYAVCKYYKLRAAGAKDNQLNFWAGKYDGGEHLVLVVKVEGKEVVMDIMEPGLPLAKDYFYAHFYPVYRFNANGWDTN